MIFFLYGTDAYLIKEKLRELKEQFIQKRDQGGFNVVKIPAKNLDFDVFKSELLTVPFLGEKKMIIIEDIFAKNDLGAKKLRTQIAEFLKAREATLENVLMFVDRLEDDKRKTPTGDLFAYLKKQKYSWQLNKLKNQELLGWLKNLAKENNTSVQPAAFTELLLLVGNDLEQLANEMEKLKNYKKGGEVTAEDVRNLVRANFDEDVFKLSDALGANNKALAIKLINDQLASGKSPLAVLALISRQFKIMLKAKLFFEEQGGTPGKLAGALGLHPYVAQKTAGQIRNFNSRQLIDLQNKLLEIEHQLKSGAKNPELLFDLLIIRI